MPGRPAATLKATRGALLPLKSYCGYGYAIYECEENERGELWVGNDEYGSQVNFCPFCGAAAKVKINDEA